MRILRVIASMNPSTGGPVEGLLQTSAVMSRFGHQTEIACLDAPGLEWLADIPFVTHPLGPSTKIYNYSRRLKPWIQKNKDRFDAVIVHGLWNYASVGTWRALASSKVPYLILAHGMLGQAPPAKYPFKKWAKKLFWFAFESRVLRCARLVLFTTEEERHAAQRAFGGSRYNARVIAYGTADIKGDQNKQCEIFKAQVPEVAQRRFLLFLGRIHPIKGCDILIEAFAGLAQKYPNVDLVIAGPDQIGWRQQLDQLVVKRGLKRRIRWLGMISGDIKWGAYRNAEAFVLPSHSESFGLAAIEAMACSLPVLITNKFNIWREVQASGGGLVGSDDIIGYRAVLDNFLGLAEDKKLAMRRAARVMFLRCFDVEETTLDLLKAVDEAKRVV